MYDRSSLVATVSISMMKMRTAKARIRSQPYGRIKELVGFPVGQEDRCPELGLNCEEDRFVIRFDTMHTEGTYAARDIPNTAAMEAASTREAFHTTPRPDTLRAWLKLNSLSECRRLYKTG